MTILVTGATGTIGRQIVELLRASSVTVRALTRRPAAAALLPAAQVVEGDLTCPECLAPALAGVDALHLFPASGPEAVVDQARRSGVRRIVVLSRGSAAHGDEFHLAVERAVRNAGVT